MFEETALGNCNELTRDVKATNANRTNNTKERIMMKEGIKTLNRKRKL